MGGMKAAADPPLCYEALPSRRGALSLRARAGGEAPRWLHSSIDPRAEAGRICRELEWGGKPLLVLVGGGLGWLAEAARGHGACAMLALDPDAQALQEAAGAAGHAFPAGLERLPGSAAQQLARLTLRQRQLGWPELLVVANSAICRIAPAWAGEILRELPPGRRRGGLDAAVRRGPFAPRRVLVIDSGYFLLRECIEGFARIGVEPLSVPLEQSGSVIAPGAAHRGPRPDGDFLERLLQAVVAGRPDFVFAVNHIGFDRGGRLLDLLDSLRLPLAVWYVDSPSYILDGSLAAARSSTLLFSWERAWIEPMRRLGFEHVMHLPLAAHGGFDRPHRPRRELVFVGGSNCEAVAKWRQRLALPAALHGEQAALLERWRARPRRSLPEDSLDEDLEILPGLRAWLNDDRRRRLASLLVLEATQRDRLELLQAFGPRRCTLYGDAGWSRLLPGWRPGPPLDYYRELPACCAASRITLNATSRQMPTALNQRAFDAPLAGSLPLGEAQADLERLFEPGRDCLAWRSPGEAVELAQRCLGDEAWRTGLVRRARRRILDEHLYTHRLRQLVDELVHRVDPSPGPGAARRHFVPAQAGGDQHGMPPACMGPHSEEA
jgi:spore maturation protein CgeB